MAPGARSKFGAPVFEPEVFRKQMYCISCDIFGTFRRPHSDLAPGKSCPLHTVVTPLVTARSNASQQIMLHSSIQRRTGTLGFRWGKIFKSPEFLHHVEETQIGEFCRAMVLFQKLAQKYREVFPEFFKSCPNVPLTSYAYGFNAETLAKY